MTSKPTLYPRPLAATAGYYAAFIVLGLNAAVVGPTLPELANRTHSHLSQISLVFAARSLGYLFGSLLGGRLYDRKPGHPILTTALVASAALIALVPVTPLLALLTLLLLALGMVEGTLDTGGNSLLIWVHGDRVSPFMNGLHFFFGIGTFLAPVIVARVILLTNNINWAFWTFAFLAVPTGIWLLNLPSPQPRLAQTAQAGRRVDTVLVWMIVAFFFLYVGAEVSYGGWVFTYATRLNLASATTAAYLTSAFWGAFTLGRLLGIPLSTRLHPHTMIFIDLVGSLVSLGTLLLWPGSTAILWLGSIGLGFFQASIFPSTLNMAERYMPVTGSITGLFLVGAGTGAMLLPWLIGQLFESIGPQITIWAITIDMALAVALLVGISAYRAKTSAPAAATPEAL